MTYLSATSDFDIFMTYGIMKAIINMCKKGPDLDAGFTQPYI